MFRCRYPDPTSALICWIGAELEDAWPHAQPAIQAAARVVRLANGLYGVREDHAQSHFTALTAALPHHRLWSRHRPRGSRWLTRLVHEKLRFQQLAISPQIARAAQSHRTVARALTTAIATFVETSAHLDPGLLAFYLQHMVAAALARYSTTRLHMT